MIGVFKSWRKMNKTKKARIPPKIMDLRTDEIASSIYFACSETTRISVPGFSFFISSSTSWVVLVASTVLAPDSFLTRIPILSFSLSLVIPCLSLMESWI